MKKFDKIYKDKFLENLGVEDNLEKIKSELVFEDNSPIELKTTKRKSLVFSLSGVCAALVAVIFAVFLFMSPKFAGDYTPTFLRMEVVDNKVRASKNMFDDSLPDGLKYPEVSYYAKPGDKVTIAVYLDNLKQYEILSFSLNQQLYPSYTFKDGSTAEVIYVDILASDTSGIQTITIDQIKYVDGTQIKEAKYKGEKTIKLGVEYTNLPTLSKVNEHIGYTNYKLDFNLTNNELITEDVIYNAYLVKDNNIVQTKKLSINDNVIEFNNLFMNSKYHVYIVCNLDVLNGLGYKPIYLYETEITTLCGLNDININSSYNEININYKAHTNVSNVSAVLYKDNVKVDEIKTGDLIFRNLNSNSLYKIEITYQYNLNGKIETNTLIKEIKTKAFSNKPSAIGQIFGMFDTVFYEVEISDIDKVITNYKITILGDGELLYEGDILTQSITVSKEYSVLIARVKIAYDFCDGLGEQTITIDIK